jgi:L-phenylalanine/L-methionine N-acetyltransferase
VIAVRKAEPGDAAQLVSLAEAVGREDGRWILSSDSWRSIADERRFVKSVYRHPDAAVYVAEEGGVILGRMSLSRDPHPASRHVADLGLMVHDRHRRRGIGTRLLDAAVEWARVAGVTKLELHVFPWNEPALRLYESFGFEREGYRKAHYDRDGELVDAILMALAVPEDGG